MIKIVNQRKIMDLIITIIMGAIAGWIASIIMKTNAEQGFILDVIVGIVGSMLGSWVFGLLGISIAAGWVGSLITAIIGACILLLILKLIMGRR
jgi:uncharacterized membrane protein YeaQ/YmgE (transglycosylase-associated protein family)